MKIKVNTTAKVDPKADIKYPVFAEWSDGDVFMFFSESTACIVKHSDSRAVGKLSDTVVHIGNSGWTLLPVGYSVTFTQS